MSGEIWGIIWTLIFIQKYIGLLIPQVEADNTLFPWKTGRMALFKHLNIFMWHVIKRANFSLYFLTECSIRGALFYILSTELALLSQKMNK
ncbi:hypothetical protein C5O87_09705 [Escherichia coli]|nr:hypothetical protein C5O87_09705 [Escherichia coli]